MAPPGSLMASGGQSAGALPRRGACGLTSSSSCSSSSGTRAVVVSRAPPASHDAVQVRQRHLRLVTNPGTGRSRHRGRRGAWPQPCLPAAATVGAVAAAPGGGAAAAAAAADAMSAMTLLPAAPLQPPLDVEVEVDPLASPAVYCQRQTLGGLLQQFATRQDGFDSGLQMEGVLSYYRQLGCSPQQLRAAMEGLMPVSRIAPPTRGSATAAANPSSSSPFPETGLSQWATASMPEPIWSAPSNLEQQLQLMAWELLVAAVAAAALAGLQTRPRGWARRDLLEVRQSSIAGRGLFARVPIPAGTVLGAYPGRLRSAAEMVAKCETAPLAASYAFRTGDGRFLDPTDALGQPSPYPQPGWPWPLPTNVDLAFANEPPKGSPGTNTTVEDGPQPGDLLFVASTDIPAGAEVLIDYGVTYDRSGYSSQGGGGGDTNNNA